MISLLSNWNHNKILKILIYFSQCHAWELLCPPKAFFLFTSTYPYFSYDKILNETLCNNIPKSSWQITILQHHIHCANYETIIFKWSIHQLLHFFYPYNIQNTPFNSYIFHLHSTYNMNWISPQKRHERIPSYLRTWRKSSSLNNILGGFRVCWCSYIHLMLVHHFLAGVCSFVFLHVLFSSSK